MTVHLNETYDGKLPKPVVDLSKKHKPRWVVNSLGELGVEIQGKCYFVYKGRSIVYGESDVGYDHDDGVPIMYRSIGKNEFGETVLPLPHIYARGYKHGKYLEQVISRPGLDSKSNNQDDYEWKPLPKVSE